MPFVKGAPKPPGSGRKKRTEHHLEIVYWPITRLKPYERNPRKNDQAVDRMVASIKEFGFTVPVLARSSGEVVDGHLRLKAAAKLHIETLPVIVCDAWSEAQVKAFRLLVNRSVGWADWDLEALAAEFFELQEMKFDLTLTGFDTKEIDQFTLTANPAEDDVPPVPEHPTSRTGDLWLLGGHRLLCGDATSAEDVARLMNGQKADMVFTDPPYGVNFGVANHNPRAKRWARITNDDKAEAKLRDFIAGCFENVIAVSVEACPVYCWSAPMAAGYDMLKALLASGIHVQSQIVWVKNCIVLGQADYQWKHEPCWYGWTPGKNHYWSGGRALSTVWEHSKDSNQSYQHPAQKPVSLSRQAIDNSCRVDGTVLDVFGGSGSTLIGCESTGRAARMMELEHGYTDVIVTRWQNLTGKSATLEGDGRTFEAIKHERFLIQLGAQDAIKEEVLAVNT